MFILQIGTTVVGPAADITSGKTCNDWIRELTELYVNKCPHHPTSCIKFAVEDDPNRFRHLPLSVGKIKQWATSLVCVKMLQ